LDLLGVLGVFGFSFAYLKLLELGLRLLVAGVLVGMILEGQDLVLGLDLLGLEGKKPN